MADPPIPAVSLQEQLRLLPDHPGVYLFRDAGGEILYVGKATSLRSRVRSYFSFRSQGDGRPTADLTLGSQGDGRPTADLTLGSQGDGRPEGDEGAVALAAEAPTGLHPVVASARAAEGKTAALVALVASVEYIVTESASEALILENNLIKQHHPKYNIRLRDDKQYPYLRIAVNDPWPRLELVRRTAADGARYFGPYPHSGAVFNTMQTLRRVFAYRSCSDRRLRQPHPCLYHHIHRCLAPCIAACTPDDYRHMIGELVQFLEGRGDGVLARLRERMDEAAADLRFEEAAELRDRITALNSVLVRQRVQSSGGEERDVLAVARGPGGDAAVCAVFYRDGKLSGREGFMLRGAEGRDDAEVLAAFVEQFYGGGAPLPPEILLSDALPEQEETAALLRARRGAALALRVPARGPKKQLIELARQNAAEHLTAELWRRERSRAAVDQALAELMDVLDLPALPRRIECYDNSNIQGTHAVAAMVVFENGIAAKGEYRKFRVKTVIGADDFATMREILGRRFAQAREQRLALAAENPDGEVPEAVTGFAHLPDLVVIDGGPGQLSAAREAMREAGMEAIPTFGLAKEHEWLYAEDRSDPIMLPETSPALRLLQRARDEAHRFGLGYHRQLRGRASVASRLEEAPGIGPKRRKALLTAFGSLEAIVEAGAERVAAVPGMSRAAAEELLTYLRSGEEERPITTRSE